MKERNWKYKITGNWFGPMVIAITTAVSGGFTFWLYTAHDGAFVGLGGLTAFFAIICVLSAYGAMSFKLLVDKDGFYFRTKPGNGRYYRYSEICSMWLSSGRETDTQEATYCNFETIEGKRSRFLVLDPHLDAVDYMIERVEAAPIPSTGGTTATATFWTAVWSSHSGTCAEAQRVTVTT